MSQSLQRHFLRLSFILNPCRLIKVSTWKGCQPYDDEVLACGDGDTKGKAIYLVSDEGNIEGKATCLTSDKIQTLKAENLSTSKVALDGTSHNH